MLIQLNYIDWKNEVSSKKLPHYSYESSGNRYLIAVNGPLEFTHKLDLDNYSDYDSLFISSEGKDFSPTISPFASKKIESGSLYRRKHGYSGTVPANSTTTINIVVPYGKCKINGLEIINCSEGDSCDLKVLDSATGSYTTIPNYLLNQFGFNVNLPHGVYQDYSKYDAEVYIGMQLSIEYTNSTGSSKDLLINIPFHEIKE